MNDKILLLVSRYHEKITSSLLQGAEDVLHKAGFGDKDLDTLWAPGAFELPCLASIALQSKRWSCLICLGCLIKGETAHFEHIAQATSNNLQRLSVESQIPVIFGVLTVNSWQQALARSSFESSYVKKTESDLLQVGKVPVGNKGQEAAEAALMVLSQIAKIKRG